MCTIAAGDDLMLGWLPVDMAAAPMGVDNARTVWIANRAKEIQTIQLESGGSRAVSTTWRVCKKLPGVPLCASELLGWAVGEAERPKKEFAAPRRPAAS